MTEAQVRGVGALERFIRLFPDMFVVEGEGQKKRVRRGVVDRSEIGEASPVRETPEIK